MAEFPIHFQLITSDSDQTAGADRSRTRMNYARGEPAKTPPVRNTGFSRMLQNLLKSRFFLPVVITASLVGFATLIGIYSYWDILGPLASETATTSWAYLKTTHPLVFFGALSVAPLLPIPISPFYIVSASLYGFGFSIAAIGVAVVINMTLTYWMANGVLRPFMEQIVEKMGHSTPTLHEDEHVKMTVIVRVTPGPPYFVQNIVLGLAGIPYRTYILVSWPIQMAWAIAFVALGESAVQGQGAKVAGAIGLLVSLILITRMVRGRLAAPDSGSEATE